ncbi:peptide/nickel transport system permease protein [Roseovarius azorensis]|uniref:Peptide/nickel transport system permease protein n=1 Tax=Roseovarius azorensis TaxID=1287727 RepID=A0A1H7Y375_9RHOB|nr:ABC transporter permease [Roseovarius azorensis]SEM39777.1 peptide/nickel transport system permease protein [Roseovarius azorensis]
MLWAMMMRRLLFGLLTLFAISVLVFVGTEILPGDVAQAVLGQSATAETIAALRERLGLDQPAPLRYLAWIAGVLQGDLGVSLASDRPIAAMISSRLGNTFMLAGIAALIVVPLSLILGLLAATRPRSLIDRAVSHLTLMSVSAPEFLIATLLVMLFAVHLNWLPAISNISSADDIGALARSIALPVLTLSLMVLAPMTRMTRNSVLSVLGSPAIETAILKGLSRRRIVLFHALPNAIAPIVNIIAMNLAYLVSGVVVVEVVFSFPGLAKLMVDAVGTRDLPLVQACALIFCSVYVLMNIFADVISVLANPKLRRSA